MKKNHLIMGAFATMLILFLGASYFYDKQKVDAQNQRLLQNADAFSKSYSPKKGSPNAKVKLVEFLDPACETCRQFHPFVKQLLEKYSGKLQVIIRYAPLHPGSDQMVAILEVAKKQGKFWEVLELMFDTQDYWASHHQPDIAAFWAFLERSGYDVEQYRKDVNDPEIARIIAQEIADGQRLGATRTPTFFVNGQPLKRFGFQELDDLIAQEIKKHY